MEMSKYIIVKVRGCELPIIFHPIISHFDMGKGHAIISAGQCEIMGKATDKDDNNISVWAGGKSITLKDDKDNYEKRFQEWKKLQNEKKELLKIDLARYNTVLDKKIKDKTEVIKEIESGISSLKEISKEQQAKD